MALSGVSDEAGKTVATFYHGAGGGLGVPVVLKST